MAADGDKTTERFVSVSAGGACRPEPDSPTISAGVLTEADNARDALSRNYVAMAKLIDGLKAAGISAQGHPDHHAQRRAALRPAQGQPPGHGQRLSGVNQVRIIVRDMKKLGELVDQAIGLGANQMRPRLLRGVRTRRR